MLEMTRRKLIGGGGSAFMIIRPELVRGFAPAKLKAGLVGCGGRGTQAAQQFLQGNQNVELTAMADVFEDKLETSLGRLQKSPFKAASR